MWHTCGVVITAEYDEKIAYDGCAIFAEPLEVSGLKTGPMFGCIKFVKKEVKCE
jgi:hypothetical protein